MLAWFTRLGTKAVAQMAEWLSSDQKVSGSIPDYTANLSKCLSTCYVCEWLTRLITLRGCHCQQYINV